VLAACGGATPAAPSPAASSPPVSSKPAAPVTSAPASSSSPASAISVSPSAVPASSAQPKTGGTLRAIKTGDVAPIDPHYHSPGNGLGDWTVHDTLTTYVDDNWANSIALTVK